MSQHQNQGKLASLKEIIVNHYTIDKWGYDKIGKKYGFSGNSIRKFLEKSGVQIRQRKIVPQAAKERMVQRYKSGLSLEESGKDEEVSACAAAVLDYLEEFGVSTRTPEEAHRKYPINEDFFDVIDTEEKAYYLGFLFADGCNQMEHFYSVILDLDIADEEILHKLANLIYKDPIHARMQVKLHDRRHEGKGIEVSLGINSKHICNRVSELGCVTRKSLILEYPKQIPDDMHRHFVRGYFDGDGSLSDEEEKVTSCKVTSTKQFLERVVEITGVPSNIYKADPNSKSNTYNLEVSGNRNIHNFPHWIYADATIYLKRKHDAYLRFCEKMRIIDEKMVQGTRGYPKSNLLKSILSNQ